MIRISQVKCRPGHSREALEHKIIKILKIKPSQLKGFEIIKQSVDARKKPDVYYTYTVDVSVLQEEKAAARAGSQACLVSPVEYRFPVPPFKEPPADRPVIIGTGPAGLFCGYFLALAGLRPLLLERGADVDARKADVERFWEDGHLNTESNVQFGEGGAGTFSDGKLNTLIKDPEGRNREVLRIFTACGAPENILYEARPHIGTDILIQVVKNLRHKIEALGGEVRFYSRVTGLLEKQGNLCGVLVDGDGELPCSRAVLAIGHSARDTFGMLHALGIRMKAKSFAVGLRAEHPQRFVNLAQYGQEEPKFLPPASYKVTAKTSSGRGVYSFCMCPGGYVVNASSEEKRLAVNGMSYSGRDGYNANSAIVVSVTPEDYGGEGPLAGIAFQRKLEERAWMLGNGRIPVQCFSDFKEGAGTYAPGGPFSPCMKGGYVYADVRSLMPEELNRALLEGMEHFGKIMPGFDGPDTLLSGIESRTSSPVRICRDAGCVSSLRGLFPCGEGAGYAGGITSAAMDGIRVAEAVAKSYQKEE